jgi:hypothetical protein
MGCHGSKVLPDRLGSHEMRELQMKFELSNAELLKLWELFQAIDIE